MSKSLTRFTPGRAKSSNSSLTFTPGVSTGPTFTKKAEHLISVPATWTDTRGRRSSSPAGGWALTCFGPETCWSWLGWSRAAAQSCKGNYAMNVKVMMSWRRVVPALLSPSIAYINCAKTAGHKRSHTKHLTKTRQVDVIIFTVACLMAPPPDPDQQKRQTLRRHGTLNPEPESVTHPLFQNNDFFDPDDLVQVKYEMLRQVHIDNNSISESARAFGFSRPSFYQAQSAFQQDGVFGLLPHKRGPQGGHKLTGASDGVRRSATRGRSNTHSGATGRQPFRSASGFKCIRAVFNGACCRKKNGGECRLRQPALPARCGLPTRISAPKR